MVGDYLGNNRRFHCFRQAFTKNLPVKYSSSAATQLSRITNRGNRLTIAILYARNKGYDVVGTAGKGGKPAAPADVGCKDSLGGRVRTDMLP